MSKKYLLQKWGSIAAGVLVVALVLLPSVWKYTSDHLEAATLNLATVQPFQACGRLTLTTATPVMVASAVSQTTVFYTPNGCNRISLYNGDNLVLYEFSELSNVTTASSTGSAGPAVVAASGVYDYFVWNNGGTLALTRGPVWTSDSARSMALSSVKGVWVNGAAITNGPANSRGLYVGTTRAWSDATINWKFGRAASGWGQAIHDVWNMYNRVSVRGIVADTADTWVYNATAIRAAGGNTSTARVSFVTGLNLDPVSALYHARVVNIAANQGFAGVGLNTTTAFGTSNGQPASCGLSQFGIQAVTTPWNMMATYNCMSDVIGAQFLSANEEANSTGGNITFYGDGAAPNVVQLGMRYELWQ